VLAGVAHREEMLPFKLTDGMPLKLTDGHSPSAWTRTGSAMAITGMRGSRRCLMAIAIETWAPAA
jgi:hypothetical protein